MKVPSVGQIAQDFHKFAFAPARGLELNTNMSAPSAPRIRVRRR